MAFAATFFPVFDVPVFWPILLLYWCAGRGCCASLASSSEPEPPLADLARPPPWCLPCRFVLFFVTMKRQILHMIKHRYVPFSFGKKVGGWRRWRRWWWTPTQAVLLLADKSEWHGCSTSNDDALPPPQTYGKDGKAAKSNK